MPIKEKKHHPKELFLLAFSGATLRYAFWGVSNLLVLYLLQSYQFSTVKATHIYAIFTGIAAFLPLLGGFLADWWNYDKPLIYGTLASALGCFFISFHQEYLLYIGLILLACGYGLFVPSMFTILGHIYHNRASLREAGFTIYYASMNIGVFVAMISIGSIAHVVGWNLSFVIAGIIQLIGFIPLIIYFKKYYGKIDIIKEKKEKEQKSYRLERHEIDRIIVILVLCIISIFFWTNYTQGWSSVSIFALNFTQKTFFGFTIPTAWYLSAESFFLITLCPLFAKFYLYLQKHKKDPAPPVKSGLSLILIGVTFIILVLASITIPANSSSASVNPLFIIGAFLFMAIAEILIAPIGLSLVTRLSPHRYTGLLVGFWYVCSGVAYYIGGSLAGLIDVIPQLSHFFTIFIVIAFVPAILLLLFTRKLNKMRHIDML